MCPGLLVTKETAAIDENAAEVHVVTAGPPPPDSHTGHVVTAGPPPDNTSDGDRPTASGSGFTPMAARPQAACSDDSSCGEGQCEASGSGAGAEEQSNSFAMEETVFIFDWDDTLLPSTWLSRQGLRLDEGSKVSPAQRKQLAEVANTAIEILNNAKQHGTVVLVTNAERGWIELSCRKFLPTLYPQLENIKAISARTAFESRDVTSPLEWKLRAFESEIHRICGSETLYCPARRKNLLSLGDSVHEREALLRATTALPNCRAKSLKFCERPDISQICKQHALVNSCFDRIVHHDGNLDLCIKCT